MNNVDITIGLNLAKLRKDAGFTQKSFGEACTPAISSQQVSKYERGEDSITGRRLLDFAAILNCSPNDLFNGVVIIRPLIKKGNIV
jgi:transcriptional regulator with XRE-family HTH domain